MELDRAFETLGLDPGASAEDVESAYRRLCDDFDARIGRVASLALRDRYAAARAELEAARAAALQAAGQQPPISHSDDPEVRARAVLGLSTSASPLEVASAYVTLCEELDRELASAPTEALRRRCLEARAEIDAAYQLCAAAPLTAEPTEDEAGEAGYRTHMAEATFEALEPEALPEPEPPTIEIATDPDPEPPRRRRRPLRRISATLALLALVLGGIAGYGWWSDADWLHQLVRYLPLPPAPELVEAQSASEYLRRRVAEERRDIQLRAQRTAERSAQLEVEWNASSELDPEARQRAGVALEQALSRHELATHLEDLAERHVFSSSELAEAYGRMELGAELAEAGETERAVAAFSEARSHLEATLATLDELEASVGARSEALAARDAWVALAASAGLEPDRAVDEGREQLEQADALLAEGHFTDATPELRRASQLFRSALDTGRREVAAKREALLAAEQKVEAERQARAEAEARVAAARRSREASRVARAEDLAGAGSGSPRERAEVKLVAVPGGAFLYGCNGIVGACPESEPAGRRAEVVAFRMDRTEVRVSEYRRCVDAGTCSLPGTGDGCNWRRPERGDHPVNCVDWDQAALYCDWVGKRLPTEREWEKAARGTDGRTYPWGNDQPSCAVAVMSDDAGAGCGTASTAPVGSRATGRSPYGLFDMAGNVLEWTVSLHESGDGARVLRGGSWQSGAGLVRSAYRHGARPELRHESVGFRCAQGGIVADNGVR